MSISKMKTQAVSRLKASKQLAEYQDSSEFTADVDTLEESVMALVNLMEKKDLKKTIEDLQKEDTSSKVLAHWKEFQKLVDKLDSTFSDLVDDIEQFE